MGRGAPGGVGVADDDGTESSLSILAIYDSIRDRLGGCATARPPLGPVGRGCVRSATLLSLAGLLYKKLLREEIHC